MSAREVCCCNQTILKLHVQRCSSSFIIHKLVQEQRAHQHHWHAGFVLEDNPADQLMVACPLPPVEAWDEAMTARALLLRQRGLSPQLFLPAAPLRPLAPPPQVICTPASSMWAHTCRDPTLWCNA